MFSNSRTDIAAFAEAPGTFQYGGFEEVDFLGNVAHRWLDPTAPDGVDGHDFLLLPNGHGVLIGLQSMMADLSGFYPADTTRN